MSEETLFHEALAKATPGERAAFLDLACAGQPELRAAVEARLAAGQAVTVDSAPEPESPGGQVGPYRLVQKIGEGGMGTVWAADQAGPVRRRVALKLIKPGMDSARVIRRFEAERQALAMMGHPNIAKVFDAGATAAGRPFFVMELVKGVPITDYCATQRLPTRERLSLFLRVCAAIQHAHQKGIIHRDIKPGNVLVCLEDGKPTPKVIDFGIAKALHHNLTDQTAATEVGSVLGTLEYMAPEQAELSALDIDTRADVYALGVLVYELLTGTTPHEHDRLRGVSVVEALRVIREEEPPPPSARSGQRILRGELDWIAMKALEKDRTRRYESPSALARDVERYLTGEAVEASPASATYRARKFLRRHRGPALAAATVLAAVLAGAGVSLWQAFRATRAESDARRESDRARENARLAREAVSRFFTRTSEETLLNQPQMQTLRKDLLRIARDYYREFVAGGAGDPELVLELGQAMFRLARIEADTGNPTLGLGLLDQAVALYSRLADGSPVEAQAKLELVRCYLTKGNIETTVASRRAAGAESYRTALRLGKDLAASLPDDESRLELLAAAHLGMAEANYSDPARYPAEAGRAAQILEGLVARRPDSAGYQYELARVYHRLGNMHLSSRRLGEARRAYEQSRDTCRRVTARWPNNPAYQSLEKSSLNDLAAIAWETGRRDEAERLFAEVWAKTEKLARDFPLTVEYQFHLATSFTNRGTWARDRGRIDEAEGHFRRAMELLETLLKAHPDSRGAFRGGVAMTYHNFAFLYQGQGRWAEAAPLWENAVAWWDECVRERDTKFQAVRFAGWACHYLGQALAQTGQPDRAIEWFRRAVERRRRDAESNPTDLWVKVNLAASLAWVGDHAEVVRLLRGVAANPEAASELVYLGAGVVAFAAARSGAAAGLYEAEAISLLERARGLGHFHTIDEVDRLASDADFSGLRTRPAFQRFLADARRLASPAADSPERLPMPRIEP